MNGPRRRSCVEFQQHRMASGTLSLLPNMLVLRARKAFDASRPCDRTKTLLQLVTWRF